MAASEQKLNKIFDQNVEITGTLTVNGTVADLSNYLTSFTETDPTVPSHVKSITTTNIANWNTAYGWGNHADAGYLTSYTETDTLATVTARGATTSAAVGFSSTGLQLSGHWYNGFYSGTTNYIHLYPNGHSGGASVTNIRAWNGTSYDQLVITGGNDSIVWRNKTLIHSGNITSYALTSETDTLDSVADRGRTTNQQLISTNPAGFRVDSGSYARIELDSTDNWSYVRLQDQGVTTWDIACYNSGDLEMRPGGGSSNRVWFSQGGNLTIESGSLYFNTSTNSGRLYSDEWGIKVGTTSGYIHFGPANTTWAHIYTDRPNFYFNKNLYVNGDLVWTAGNDGAGTGLTADTVDGYHASNLVRISEPLFAANTSDDTSGPIEFIRSSGVGWDDYIIKHGSSKGMFGKQGIAWHNHTNSSFHVMSSGWTSNFGVNSDGTTVSRTSSRAPLFYDSNDTNYYLNPNGVSFLNQVDGPYFRNIQVPSSGLGSSYDERVILLIPKVETNTSYNNRIHGKLTMGKTGGNVIDFFDIHAQSVYNNTTVSFTSSGQRTGHKLVTCTYNGIKWVAIKFQYTANPYNFAWFHGEAITNFSTQAQADMLRVISYADLQSGTVILNSEIYNSIADYTPSPLHKKISNGGGDFRIESPTQSTVNMSSPIYYDYNNSSYYIDPDTTGVSINVRGEIQNPNVWINDGNNWGNYNENIRLFVPTSNAGSPCVIAFGASGTSGTPVSSILGYSDRLEQRWGGTWQERVYNGYVVANGSYRAPIFYDSNNTTYYVDPSSSGTSARFAGNLEIYARSAAWAEGLRVRVPTVGSWGGIRWTRDRANYDGNWALGYKGAGDTTDDLVFWANNGGTERVKMRISKDSKVQIGSDGESPNLALIYDDNHANGDRWDTVIQLGKHQERWSGNSQYPTYVTANGYGMSIQSNSDGVIFGMEEYSTGNYRPVIAWGDDSSDSPFVFRFNNGSKFEFGYTGVGYAASDWRAPIFYDSNNTGYYLNPAGTSNLYDINMPHLANGTENLRANVGGQENWRAIALSGGPQDNVGWGIHGSSRSVFGLAGTSIHYPDNGSFRLHTNGWDTEFEVAGGGTAWLKGEFRAGGDIIAYYSDERLKTKTGLIENPIDKVKSLTAFYYKHNEKAKEFGFDGDEIEVGLSAQEVQKVMPEVIRNAPFDMVEDGEGNVYSKSGEDYLTLKYDRLVPLLIEAVKELSNKVEELENKLNGSIRTEA